MKLGNILSSHRKHGKPYRITLSDIDELHPSELNQTDSLDVEPNRVELRCGCKWNEQWDYCPTHGTD